MQAFRLVEKQLEANCREIQIEGELDLTVADRLQDALNQAVKDRGQVLIGLERCDFIDSTGIAVIVWASNQLNKGGGHLAVYGPSGQVLRSLDVTGLTENGLVFTTADEARVACAD
jgi:anti-sigma B factor antagonist